MRVAFHFNAEAYGASYGPPTTELLFRELIECIPAERRHGRIARGDLCSFGTLSTTGMTW